MKRMAMKNRNDALECLSEEKYSRSLTSEDYEALTEEQRELLVHKKNIFPVLPYRKWKQAGISPAVAITVKLFRQMLPDRPSEVFIQTYPTRAQAEKAWIGALGKMNELLTGRGTEKNLPPVSLDDLVPKLFKIAEAWMSYRFEKNQRNEDKAIGRAIESVYEDNLKNKGLWIVSQFSADVGRLSDGFAKGEENSVEDKRFRDLLQSRAMNVRELIKDWFGIDEQIYFSGQAETKDRERMWELVSKSRSPDIPAFGKTIDANAAVTGQRRSISRHVCYEELKKDFGLREIDLPTWLSEQEKQTLLDVIYDSFDQLAEALKFSRKEIGLNGELSIGMTSDALRTKTALYRPEQKIIELPRVQEEAQLAHAWFDAFDHLAGGISKTSVVRQAMETVSVDAEHLALTSASNLLDSIERFVHIQGLFGAEEMQVAKRELTEFVISETSLARKRMTESADFVESTKERDKVKESGERSNDPELWNACMRREFLNLRNAFAIHCFDLARDASEKGILINSALIGLAQKAVETAYVTAAKDCRLDLKGREVSEFKKNAERLDAKEGNGPNLITPRQMFLRAGVAYVNSRLSSKGQNNVYLVSIKNNQKELYPEGRELVALNTVLEAELLKRRNDLKALVCETIVESKQNSEIQVLQQEMSANVLSGLSEKSGAEIRFAVREKTTGKYRR